MKDKTVLLQQLIGDVITREAFLKAYFDEVSVPPKLHCRDLINTAMEVRDEVLLSEWICLLELGVVGAAEFSQDLSLLLLADWHHSHEDTARLLLTVKDPQSVDALFQAASLKLAYLDYDDTFQFARKCIKALAAIANRLALKRLQALAWHENSVIAGYAQKELQRLRAQPWERLHPNPALNWSMVEVDTQVESLAIEVLAYDPKDGSVRIEVFGRVVELQHALDMSEQINRPTLHCSLSGGNVLIWGGLDIFLISKASGETKSLPTHRELQDVKYWRAQLLVMGGMHYFICESCVMAINAAFRLGWRTEVYYDFRLVGNDDSTLKFEDADGEIWVMQLEDGRLARG